MTFEERAYLRRAISDARRAKLRELGDPYACRGCGCHFNSRTEGCDACSDRHTRRERKARTRSEWYASAPTERLRARRMRVCFRCGSDYTAPTDGCVTCHERTRRAARFAA